MSHWQTSNSAYGAGVVLDMNQKLERRYEKLAAAARQDREYAAAAQSDDAWQLTEAVAEQHVTPRMVEPRARPPQRRQPSSQEVAAGAERLRQRLRAFGLREKPIRPDGACQFRAVAEAIYGDQELHAEVRERALALLRTQKERFVGFVEEESWELYLQRMARIDEWGDNLTLQSLADAFDVDINVISSFAEGGVLCILPLKAASEPATAKPRQQVFLGYYADVHYVSVERAPARLD